MTKNLSLKQNNSCRFVFCFVWFSVCFLFLWFRGVNAAELKVLSPASKFSVDQQSQVDLILDTKGENINAIMGKIAFPADLLEIKEIRDGNSVINFWVEKPSVRVVSCSVSCELVFSGIIPGGYQGTKGFLFSVVFRARASGSGAIEVEDAKVLLNDGKGTSAETKIFNFQFSIFKEAPPLPLMVEAVKDTKPPEEFKLEVTQSPEVFDEKWFLAFATQDKGLGIDHYEILEFRSWDLAFSKILEKVFKLIPNAYEIAESPYLLKDQKLKSYIYVKAVDKAGNERLAVVEPLHPIRWYEIWWIWGIIGIGVIVIYLIGKILWRKYKIRN